MPIPGDAYNPWRMFNGCFIPNAVLRCPELSARAKLVFGRLCQYAGENGEAFPSYRSLAREVGVERRCAMKAVKELEEFRLIKSVSRWRNDGAPATNVYVFLWHEIFQHSAEPVSRGAQNDTRGGGQIDTTLRCSNGYQMVSTRTPKEIHTKESNYEETTTKEIRRVLDETPLNTVADRELQALAKRHGQNLLLLVADIAAETWRREREEIRNPGGYLQTLCNALVIPGWYEPGAERQAKIQTMKSRNRAEQEAQLHRQAEAAQQDARLDGYWQSLPAAERSRFTELVTEAYPTLQLPAVAITATAKALAWEHQQSQVSSRRII